MRGGPVFSYQSKRAILIISFVVMGFAAILLLGPVMHLAEWEAEDTTQPLSYAERVILGIGATLLVVGGGLGMLAILPPRAPRYRFNRSCRKCGYPLKDIPSRVCPECGTICN